MDGCQSSGGCKALSATTTVAAAAVFCPPEQGLRCPRCDSPNTKFCYFNNYSLSQPRYFCKSCRRYWTKDGALRNVPVGGGSRKTKKTRVPSSSSLSSSASSTTSLLGIAGEYLTGHHPQFSFDHSSGQILKDFSGDITGLSSLSSSSSQLVPFNGGEYSSLSLSGCNGTGANTSTAAGFLMNNYPLSETAVGIYNSSIATSDDYPTAVSSIASSIESLSSINQYLHWKLQQQRVAALLGSSEDKDDPTVALQPPADPVAVDAHHDTHHHQPFQLAENSSAEKLLINVVREAAAATTNMAPAAAGGGISYWNGGGMMTQKAWSVADGIHHQFTALP